MEGNGDGLKSRKKKKKEGVQSWRALVGKREESRKRKIWGTWQRKGTQDKKNEPRLCAGVGLK